jgi:hypothetical protein
MAFEKSVWIEHHRSLSTDMMSATCFNTYLFKKSLALSDPCLLLGLTLLVLNGVNLEVSLGVLDLEMGLFDEMRNLLELVIGVIRVVEHDAVEDLSQMGVQVELDSAALVAGLLKLCLNALKSFQAYAHLYLFILIYI